MNQQRWWIYRVIILIGLSAFAIYYAEKKLFGLTIVDLVLISILLIVESSSSNKKALKCPFCVHPLSHHASKSVLVCMQCGCVTNYADFYRKKFHCFKSK